MKAVFCGNGTLLVECARIFQEAGGEIAGLISEDPRIVRWAKTVRVPHLGALGEAALADLDPDYLFSVANLRILDSDLIGLARRMAINFHDGPLPGRAGLNVPAWALLAGESQHGVTWHQMTENVDRGRVLKLKSFDIGDDETAVSLNARCYEAGIETFRDLVTDLRLGLAVGQPQEWTSQWHGPYQRPDGLGLLDPSLASAALVRMVRALDFGAYENPLSRAKVWTGKRLLLVKEAQEVSGSGQSGEVIRTGPGGLVISTTDGALALSGLADLDGTTVKPDAAAAEIGKRLPALDVPPRVLVQSVGRAEARWKRLLQTAVPALPPYPRGHRSDAGFHEIPLATDVPPATLAAAWIGWVSGMTGAARASLSIATGRLHPILSNVLPMTLDAWETPKNLIDAVVRQIGETRKAGPMAADLPARFGNAELNTQARAALSVVLIDGADTPDSATIVLASHPTRVLLRKGLYDLATAESLGAAFASFLAAFQQQLDAPTTDLPLGADPDLTGPSVASDDAGNVADLIARAAAASPDALALEAGSESLTFGELWSRADALAGALSARGAGPGNIVGLCVGRSADLVIGMLAILRAGAVYLPLDPDYPSERIAYMVSDAKVNLILCPEDAAGRHNFDSSITVSPDETGATPVGKTTKGELAYLIYTSGSTGRPKGVMVPHRSVLNFLSAMDRIVPMESGARVLAHTSVSFDISVLEILWTLSRGATVVLPTDQSRETRRPDFSLFYFASEASGTGHAAYRLLLEGAKFADANGFTAVWTPERHFHAFGGLFPNPAVAASALAGITQNVQLRAGSCVLPLHHPVRVAEDWALVDNLSNGRAGIALASGWQPNDFLLRPEAFEDRKSVMLEGVETLRALWRGESRRFPGHDGNEVEIEIHPRPMQADVPLWMTAAGNPETFEAAGRLGCGVLTHLLGQTFEEVGEKIRAYRAEWRKAGHPGTGHVVLMLHTFIGETEDAVLKAAKAPMKSYLKSAVDLVRRAAWTFPTIVERAGVEGLTPQEVFEREELSAEDLDQLLDHAFERYYQSAGLFGTPESAREIVAKVAEVGANEIGCLIDFGVDTETVLENLPNIKRLMDDVEAAGKRTKPVDVASVLAAGDITHLQCTPSLAALLVADPQGRDAIGQLSAMLVGGEVLSPDLARALCDAGPATLLNMYGPTETTVWSSVASVDANAPRVSLGAPVANTTLSVRAPDGRALPNLVEGELWIGGTGVSDGYWNQPDLTARRFIETPECRFYRTGDLVRRRPGGELEFLGRMDGQVKIRGHRIEVGEVEAALCVDASVGEAVVRAVPFGEADIRLVAYITAGTAEPDIVDLRSRLTARLPEVMVPSEVVVLAELPLTPNGKIDRNALPIPVAGSGDATGPIVTAADETEARIAKIWSQALGRTKISVTGNFFDLGGHSLLVVHVQRQMKEELGCDVSITDLFRFPTVRAIAAHLAGDDEPGESAAYRGTKRAAARRARLGRR